MVRATTRRTQLPYAAIQTPKLRRVGYTPDTGMAFGLLVDHTTQAGDLFLPRAQGHRTLPTQVGMSDPVQTDDIVHTDDSVHTDASAAQRDQLGAPSEAAAATDDADSVVSSAAPSSASFAATASQWRTHSPAPTPTGTAPTQVGPSPPQMLTIYPIGSSRYKHGE